MPENRRVHRPIPIESGRPRSEADTPLMSEKNCDHMVRENPRLADEAASKIVQVLTRERNGDRTYAQNVLGLNDAGVRLRFLDDYQNSNQPRYTSNGGGGRKGGGGGTHRQESFTNSTPEMRKASGKKRLYKAAALMAAGALGLAGIEYGVGQLNPPAVIGSHETSHSANAELEAFVKTSKLCFAKAIGASSVTETLQMQTLGVDIPGASSAVTVHSTIEHELCLNTHQTSVSWSDNDETVTVNVTPNGLVNQDKITDSVTDFPDDGLAFRAIAIPAAIQNLLTSAGLPKNLNQIHQNLQTHARNQSAESFVAYCGPISYRQFLRPQTDEALRAMLVQFSNGKLKNIKIELPDGPANGFHSQEYNAIAALHQKDVESNAFSFETSGPNLGKCTQPTDVPVVTDEGGNVVYRGVKHER